MVWLSYFVWKWWNIITHKPHNASYIHGVIRFWSYLVPIPKTAYHKTNTSYHQSYLVWESWNMIPHKPHNASLLHGVIWFWSYLVLVKTGECDKLYWCYVVWLSYLVWKWWNIITHKPHNASYIHGVIWFWSYLVLVISRSSLMNCISQDLCDLLLVISGLKLMEHHNT